MSLYVTALGRYAARNAVHFLGWGGELALDMTVLKRNGAHHDVEIWLPARRGLNFAKNDRQEVIHTAAPFFSTTHIQTDVTSADIWLCNPSVAL